MVLAAVLVVTVLVAVIAADILPAVVLAGQPHLTPHVLAHKCSLLLHCNYYV